MKLLRCIVAKRPGVTSYFTPGLNSVIAKYTHLPIYFSFCTTILAAARSQILTQSLACLAILGCAATTAGLLLATMTMMRLIVHVVAARLREALTCRALVEGVAIASSPRGGPLRLGSCLVGIESGVVHRSNLVVCPALRVLVRLGLQALPVLVVFVRAQRRGSVDLSGCEAAGVVGCKGSSSASSHSCAQGSEARHF